MNEIENGNQWYGGMYGLAGAALGQTVRDTPAVDFTADPHADVPIPAKPAERPYTLQNDSCLEYLTPANYSNPLVYEDELIYSTDADGKKTASWVSKQSLQLPIFCRVCETDDSDGLSKKAFSETRQAADENSLPDIRPVVVYLGTQFLRGSTVCAWSHKGKAAIQPELQDLISADKVNGPL